MNPLRGAWTRVKNKLSPKPLREWYHVKCEEKGITWEVNPPVGERWSDEIKWEDIECVCFEAKGVHDSDRIIIFTSLRKESYIIPTEADGGDNVLPELVHRKLFNSDVAIQTLGATQGLFCCPDLNEYLSTKQSNKK